MPRGGAREGAGRKKGDKNKLTKERELAVQQAAIVVEQALGEAFKGDAHTLLMAVYKDMSLPIETRMDAAKAAIKFEKPALAATAVMSSEEVEAVKDVPRETGADHLAPLAKRFAEGRLRLIEGGQKAKAK